MASMLIPAITTAIAGQNPNAAARFTRTFRSKAISDEDTIQELNRFWRSELMALHVSTISARSCLVDDIEPEDWLRHFKRLVLPTIIDHDLPH